MEKEYTTIFVDIVIELLQDLPKDAIKRVYDEAHKEDISGIDTFRDWIYDWARALESFYRLEGDDPNEWSYDIVDTCECVADMMACATLKKEYFNFEYGKGTDSGLAVPTRDEMRKALERRHKHMKKESVTYTELLYNKLKKKKKK
jgi:hypothetical protein